MVNLRSFGPTLVKVFGDGGRVGRFTSSVFGMLNLNVGEIGIRARGFRS